MEQYEQQRLLKGHASIAKSNAIQIPINTEHCDRSFASMARTALPMDLEDTAIMLDEIDWSLSASTYEYSRMSDHV